MKANNIKVTTTSSFDGVEIEEYLEPITAHVVVGMNFFKDFLSGLTDIFGGNSTSYQNTLSGINNEVINELRKKAFSIGANCILGLKIDNDEISAQGKSMMMVTALGTAAKARFSPKTENMFAEKKADKISNEHLLFMKKKREYLNYCKKGTLNFTEDFWSFARANKINELAPFILEDYFKKLESSTYYDNEQLNGFKNHIKEYFEGVDSEIAIKFLYDALSGDLNNKTRNNVCQIINELQLIDYISIKRLLSDNDFNIQRCSVQLLKGEKDSYEKTDIEHLINLKDIISNTFTERGVRSTKKKALSSKEKEIWICDCGIENNVNEEYCTSCQKNIFGFFENDFKPSEVIDKLTIEIEILEEAIR